jgi:hypothetical protein
MRREQSQAQAETCSAASESIAQEAFTLHVSVKNVGAFFFFSLALAGWLALGLALAGLNFG